MDIAKIPAGRNPPWDINVIIEIPQGSGVKYQVDQASGALVVDRFLAAPMTTAAAFGFVPLTRADHGEPLEALVLVPAPTVPGTVVRARPIGMLMMEGETGFAAKIVCVPYDRTHPRYSLIESIDDLSEATRTEIERFFQHTEQSDTDHWVRITRWAPRRSAEAAIERALACFSALIARAAE